MLEGDVEIGQHLALGHQLDHVVDMRIGIDVVQPHPGAERAEFAGEVEEPRRDLAVAPGARRNLMSRPYALVSCEITKSSLTPGLHQLSASRRTSPAGRDTSRRAASG